MHQLRIDLWGFNSIPKLLLNLANINKNENVSYDSLTKDEKRKFEKTYEKIKNSIFCTLTYIGSDNLIHVKKVNNDYFYKTSDSDRYLIYEELEELKDYKIYYVLYRKDNGWLRGSMLTGYLLRRKNHEKEEVVPLFKFPERIMRWSFFTKGLQNKHHLKEDVVADYIDKDELGYSGGIYRRSYNGGSKDINVDFEIL